MSLAKEAQGLPVADVLAAQAGMNAILRDKMEQYEQLVAEREARGAKRLAVKGLIGAGLLGAGILGHHLYKKNQEKKRAENQNAQSKSASVKDYMLGMDKEAWDSVFGPRLPPKDEQADLKDAISAAVTGTKTKRQQEIDSIVKELRRRDSFGYYVPRWPGSPYSGSVKFKSKTAHMDFYSSLRSFAKAPAYTFFQNLGWELAGTGSDIVATSGGESLFEQFLTWGGGLR